MAELPGIRKRFAIVAPLGVRFRECLVPEVGRLSKGGIRFEVLWRSLSKAVHAGLLDEINSLRSDIGRLGESGDRLREKTVAQRLVIYKRLKTKTEMRQDLPRTQQDQAQAGIVGLERTEFSPEFGDDL